MRHLATASLAALALGLAACGGGADDDAANDMAANNGMMADNGVTMDEGESATPADTAEFVSMAAASDMYEIESSRLAAEKAQRPEVREFAQMLVTDHEKSTADLKSAASEASPPITVAAGMNARQQSDVEALRNASDADFDRLYLAQQVPAHEQALEMLRSYAEDGDAEPIKAWAGEVDDVVSGHLDRARELSR